MALPTRFDSLPSVASLRGDLADSPIDFRELRWGRNPSGFDKQFAMENRWPIEIDDNFPSELNLHLFKGLSIFH